MQTRTRRTPARTESIDAVESDRVLPMLRFGVIFVVISILTVVTYGLIAGVLRPAAPRTAAEFAIQRAERVTKEKPTSGRAWADYILLLNGFGDRSAAHRALEDARAAVTDESLLYVNNAELQLLLDDGEYEKVLERSQEFIQFDSDLRAKQMAEFGAQGIVVPQEFLRDRNIPTVELLVLRARAGAALEDWDDALIALDTAIRADGTASDVITMRGYIYLDKGEADKARADFEEALRYLPDYQPALDGLKRLDASE